jgi:hypothetical protein
MKASRFSIPVYTLPFVQEDGGANPEQDKSPCDMAIRGPLGLLDVTPYDGPLSYMRCGDGQRGRNSRNVRRARQSHEPSGCPPILPRQGCRLRKGHSQLTRLGPIQVGRHQHRQTHHSRDKGLSRLLVTAARTDDALKPHGCGHFLLLIARSGRTPRHGRRVHRRGGPWPPTASLRLGAAQGSQRTCRQSLQPLGRRQE